VRVTLVVSRDRVPSATVRKGLEPVVSKDQYRRVSIADVLDRLTSYEGIVCIVFVCK